MLSCYLQLVRILRWTIELGRIDILYDTLLMLQYQANPWIGHLEVLYHIFAYLKSHTKMGCISYNLMGSNVDLLVFNDNAYWTEFYVEVEEELTPKIPGPHGKAVSIYLFVDTNHACNIVTRQLHTGIITFIQNAPIIWFNKR